MVCHIAGFKPVVVMLNAWRKANGSLLLAHTACHVDEQPSDVSVVGRRSSTIKFLQVVLLGFIFQKFAIKLYLIEEISYIKGGGTMIKPLQATYGNYQINQDDKRLFDNVYVKNTITNQSDLICISKKDVCSTKRQLRRYLKYLLKTGKLQNLQKPKEDDTIVVSPDCVFDDLNVAGFDEDDN